MTKKTRTNGRAERTGAHLCAMEATRPAVDRREAPGSVLRLDLPPSSENAPKNPKPRPVRVAFSHFRWRATERATDKERRLATSTPPSPPRRLPRLVRKKRYMVPFFFFLLVFRRKKNAMRSPYSLPYHTTGKGQSEGACRSAAGSCIV